MSRASQKARKKRKKQTARDKLLRRLRPIIGPFPVKKEEKLKMAGKNYECLTCKKDFAHASGLGLHHKSNPSHVTELQKLARASYVKNRAKRLAKAIGCTQPNVAMHVSDCFGSRPDGLTFTECVGVIASRLAIRAGVNRTIADNLGRSIGDMSADELKAKGNGEYYVIISPDGEIRPVHSKEILDGFLARGGGAISVALDLAFVIKNAEERLK